MKKLLMYRGILLHTLNKENDAQDSFLDCMESGVTFDPRIRSECIRRIIQIQRKRGNTEMVERLQKINEQFNKRRKDYMFLVNEDVKHGLEESRIEVKIKRSIELIFDSFVSSEDRISLLSYGRNPKLHFNLVRCQNNRVQLKN
jgi:hypothetical protein